MAKILSREDILAVQDLVTEEVEVPEWGGSVFIRTMTGAERSTWETQITGGQLGSGGDIKVDISDLREHLLVRVIVDEKGERMFTDKEIKVLGGKSAAALDRLFEVAQRLNRLSDRDMEELEKNSVSALNGGSGSD